MAGPARQGSGDAMAMTSEDLRAERARTLTPLHTEASEAFLAGQIDAEQYLRDARLAAERRAWRDLRRADGGGLPVGRIFALIGAAAYGLIALLLFSVRYQGPGLVAAVLCLACTALMFVRAAR